MVEPSPPRINIVKSCIDFLGLILRRAFSQANRHSRSMVRLDREGRDLYLKIRLRFYAIHLAVRYYQPENYSDKLYLYLTDESHEDRRKNVMRWAEYSATKPVIGRILGTHASITGKYGTPISEAGMRSLASRLRSDIEPKA
jgi:hypothetical protein